MFQIVVAIAEDSRIIGLNGDLPWKLRADLQRFKSITKGHTVIMGRKTWESIPPKFRPLPDRRNIVLTGNPEYVADGAEVFHSLEMVLNIPSFGEKLFIIGGESVFKKALPVVDVIHLTVVEYDGDGDTYLPFDPWEDFIPDHKTVETVPADDKNSHASTYMVLKRRKKDSNT